MKVSAAAIEALAVALIVVVIALATAHYLDAYLRRRAPAAAAYEDYRRRVGRALLLTLEIRVASLMLEIEGRWPWQRRAVRSAELDGFSGERSTAPDRTSERAASASHHAPRGMPVRPYEARVPDARLVRGRRCSMEHLGRPVPIVAFAAVLMTVGCSAKAQSPSAAPAQPPSAATAQSQPAAATKPSDVVSSDILDEIALTRAAIQTRRQAIVTAAMDLTAPESEKFWPLYRDYRTDMAKVDDRLVDLIIVYAGNYNSMTDDTAAKLLNDYLDIERARLDVKDRYVPRFMSVLPASKVARFFQVDNKLDKKIQAELAAEIPLTR